MPNYRTQTEFMYVRTVAYGANIQEVVKKIHLIGIGSSCVRALMCVNESIYIVHRFVHILLVKKKKEN